MPTPKPSHGETSVWGDCPIENEILKVDVEYLENEIGRPLRITGLYCPSMKRFQCPYLQKKKCPVAWTLFD